MLIDLWDANDKYGRQRVQARRRGIAFNISFEDWMNVWLSSGHWNQRGKGRGKYNMSRINDSGAYEVGNVFIQSHEQNASDGHRGKPKSAEHNLKNSQSNKIAQNDPVIATKRLAAWRQSFDRRRAELDNA